MSLLTPFNTIFLGLIILLFTPSIDGLVALELLVNNCFPELDTLARVRLILELDLMTS